MDSLDENETNGNQFLILRLLPLVLLPFHTKGYVISFVAVLSGVVTTAGPLSFRKQNK